MEKLYYVMDRQGRLIRAIPESKLQLAEETMETHINRGMMLGYTREEAIEAMNMLILSEEEYQDYRKNKKND